MGEAVNVATVERLPTTPRFCRKLSTAARGNSKRKRGRSIGCTITYKDVVDGTPMRSMLLFGHPDELHPRLALESEPREAGQPRRVRSVEHRSGVSRVQRPEADVRCQGEPRQARFGALPVAAGPQRSQTLESVVRNVVVPRYRGEQKETVGERHRRRLARRGTEPSARSMLVVGHPVGLCTEDRLASFP